MNHNFLIASVLNNNIAAAKLLIDKNAFIEQEGYAMGFEGTPLRIAILSGHVDMVKLLLKPKADPTRKMQNRYLPNKDSAFDCPLKQGNAEMLSAFSGYLDEKNQKIVDDYVTITDQIKSSL